MQKFLYLTKHEWANSWVNGGKIPLSPASTYKSMERAGIYTPDENLIYESAIDLDTLEPYAKFEGNNLKNINLTLKVNGKYLAIGNVAHRYEEDGIILSLCEKKSSDICKRLGKVCCVRINDVTQLKSIIDEQLGVIGKSGPCQYTNDHQRNHFLKHTSDQWQHEYRLFWPIKQRTEVMLPSGIAKKIKVATRA